MKCGGNLAGIVQKKKSYRNVVERSNGKSPFRYFDIDERKMLRFAHHAMLP
jgi:hypothetical protein